MAIIDEKTCQIKNKGRKNMLDEKMTVNKKIIADKKTMAAEKILEPKLYYVLGLGQTGISVVRYLKRKQQLCEVFEDKISPAGLAAFQAEFPDIRVHLHENPDVSMEHTAENSSDTRVHEVIISPGVPLEHPIAQKAKKAGIPIIGDIELFVRENTAPVVAITGTNGKSTVTALVGEMAKAAGLNVLVGGNIGVPVLDFLAVTPQKSGDMPQKSGDMPQKSAVIPEKPVTAKNFSPTESSVQINNQKKESFDWIILELSSFQLESTYSLHPKIACILNITEDHMDRYETFEDYVNAKHRVYNHAEHLVISADDELTRPKDSHYQQDNNKNTIEFGLLSSQSWHIKEDKEHNKKYLSYNHKPWLDVNDLKIKGTHNWSNALAALAMGKLMGLNKEILCQVLREFTGLEHRCKWVRELNHVNWYNDSKGTNVGATLSAIKGFGGALTGKMILLLGGQSKGADFADLCESLKEHVRAVILYGEDADKIEVMLKKSENMVPIIRKKTFDEVIQAAYQEALPNDAVLLSPACASWDMFENYGHRGRVFTEMVLQLK